MPCVSRDYGTFSHLTFFLKKRDFQCAKNIVKWHINKGRIFAIIQDRKYLVSKYSLIKFLASDKGFAMQPKSEWHEKAIKWFIEVMYK